MTEKISCVDANFVVKLVTTSSETSPHVNLWDQWEENQTQIISSTLLCYEITNVFHRMRRAGQLTDSEALQSLNNALNLPIRYYSDRIICQKKSLLVLHLKFGRTVNFLVKDII